MTDRPDFEVVFTTDDIYQHAEDYLTLTDAQEDADEWAVQNPRNGWELWYGEDRLQYLRAIDNKAGKRASKNVL